jgi:predicted O-methyltransferase YrrM
MKINVPWGIKKTLFNFAPTFLRNIYFASQPRTEHPNWFLKAQPEFEKFLLPLKFKTLDFLQIGAFVGSASVWMLNEVLTSSGSRLHDVDTWQGSEEHPQLNLKFNEIETAYNRDVLIFPNVVKMKMISDAFFASNNMKFDFIYVDGDHHRDQVAIDAENAIKVCRLGGIIAFDDYEWDAVEGSQNRPKEAIDDFLRKYENSLKILHKQYQVWVQVISPWK